MEVDLTEEAGWAEVRSGCSEELPCTPFSFSSVMGRRSLGDPGVCEQGCKEPCREGRGGLGVLKYLDSQKLQEVHEQGASP